MSQYPDLAAADPFAAETLRAMIDNIYVKANSTDRTTTAVVANDPDLAGIPLGVGTWHIRFKLMWAVATATPDFKTQWAFTGTWNTPARMCVGPAISNAAIPTAITVWKTAAVGVATDSTYGGGGGSVSQYYITEEEAFDITVTVAGDLALAWAQNTSSADITRLRASSVCVTKQIA